MLEQVTKEMGCYFEKEIIILDAVLHYSVFAVTIASIIEYTHYVIPVDVVPDYIVAAAAVAVAVVVVVVVLVLVLVAEVVAATAVDGKYKKNRLTWQGS